MPILGHAGVSRKSEFARPRARDHNLPLPRYRGAIAGYKWAFSLPGDETFCPLPRHSDKSGVSVSVASLKIRG